MILASNNINKVKEIKSILEVDLKSLSEAGINIEVEEDQDTFYGNALKKAKEIYEIAKEPVIADDSGLCIKSLDDFPGVMTHRFMGENATEKDRNNKIIELLLDKDDRTATFVCNLVYYDGNEPILGVGILKGTIVDVPRGNNGFGFDFIFELDNGKTLAELTPEEKNAISARYLAAQDLKRKLKRYQY